MRSNLLAPILLLIVIASLSCASDNQSGSYPVAKNGILDLNDWNFEADGPVPLKGEWMFYWKELIDPFQESGSKESPDDQIAWLPGAWENSTIKGLNKRGEGYASYKLRVYLKNTQGRLALHLPEIRTAFAVFVNGNQISSVGVIGTNKKNSEPYFYPHIASFSASGETLDIILQVSNFQMYRGGVLTPIMLGSEKEMLKSWNRNQSLDFFVFGSLIMIGLYHLGLFLFRQSERSPLYFGLICLLISFRILVQGNYYLVHYFPEISWETVIRLDYLTFYITVPLFLYFAHSLFPTEFHKKILVVAVFICSVFSLAVILLSPTFFSHTTTIYQVITLVACLYLFRGLVRSFLQKNEGAFIFLAGFVLLFVTVINDILYENDIIKIGILVPFGMFVFIFAQAFLISIRFSRSFQAVEKLSVELQLKSAELNNSNTELASLNENLEKKVEDRTRDLNETVHQLKLAIQRSETLAKEALSANAAKSAFLANMSHEIRTPMNGIIGMANLLLETSLDDEQSDYAKIVKSSADSLLIIIDDILDFSKIEAGKLKFEIIDFDLRTTLDNVTDLLSHKAKEKNLEFTCWVNFDVPTSLKGDPGRLRQILINLSGNAIKFTDSGEILIIVKPEHETDDRVMLRFEIIDSGIGISEEEQKVLFRSFTQVDPSVTRKYGGTGLGLAISKQLTEMMNGEIGVISEPGQGSTFWFTAEFAKQSGDDAATPRLPEDIKGRRILLVDAVDNTRKPLEESLDNWGCQYESACDGDEALSKLKKASLENRPFEIAILDIHLPKMNGRLLGAKIKEDPDLKTTQLILMSNTGVKGDALNAWELGFNAYFTRPVDPHLIYQCILTLIGRQFKEKSERGQTQLITRYSLQEIRDKKVHILLAEDNKVNQKLAFKILEKKGYRVDIVENGHEAIAALEKTCYDLVLMDLQMPGLGGLEATRIIRSEMSNVRNHQIPIIAMTAHVMKEDRDKCMEVGMDGYVSKPINKDRLFEEIEKQLS